MRALLERLSHDSGGPRVAAQGEMPHVRFRTRARTALISAAAVAVTSAPAVARQEPADTAAILVAAAAHVREEMPEGRIGLEPETFPMPSAMQAVAEMTGNAVVTPIEVRCPRRNGQGCKTTPHVRAEIIFKELHLINPDSATVLIEFHEYPPIPFRGKFK